MRSRQNSPTASEINVQLGWTRLPQQVIRRFEHDELLEKRTVPLDGRAYILRLTPRGEHVLKALEKAAEQKTSGPSGPIAESG